MAIRELFMRDGKSPKRLPGRTVRLAGLGVELAASVAGCCLLGYWIDGKFETSPWAFLICAAVGIVGGTYNMIRRSLHDTVGRADQGKVRRKDGPGGGVDA